MTHRTVEEVLDAAADVINEPCEEGFDPSFRSAGFCSAEANRKPASDTTWYRPTALPVLRQHEDTGDHTPVSVLTPQDVLPPC